jgi:glycosyltransferase involved in cell wall biosynthesis
MRVLHVYSGNLYGGIETLLATLARRTDHSFALCFEGRLSRELPSWHALGEVRCSRPLTVRRARRNLKQLLARECFDAMVCHASWSQALFAPVARKMGLAQIFWLHDAIHQRTWLDVWAARHRPDVTIANSNFTAGTAARLFPNVPVRVMHYPVESPRASLAAHDVLKLRQELRTDADAVVIVQASRMERWKGQLLHLQALARLKDVDGWVCWMAGGVQRPGEAAYFAEMRELAAKLGVSDRVRFLGQRNDVPALLHASDIHCQPNAGPEPFGIAFIEALHHGLPVVTTAMGAAPEIVTEDCGMLVEPTAEALAAALRVLIGDRGLRQRLSAQGPARASALCDPARQTAALDSILRGCVSSRMEGSSHAHCVS